MRYDLHRRNQMCKMGNTTYNIHVGLNLPSMRGPNEEYPVYFVGWMVFTWCCPFYGVESTFLPAIGEKDATSIPTAWWFQPLWKILVRYYISKGSKGPNCIDGKSDRGSNWEEERNTVLATAHLYVIKYMQVVTNVWSKLVRFSNTNCPNHPHYPPPILNMAMENPHL